MQQAEISPPQHYDFVDGLRAVAIILVLLFHFDLLHFPGGFLGVDVFFVISGFLVSGIILRDLDSGRFSLATFYRRRVLRIFPALYVTLFITLVGAYFFLLPDDAIRTAKSAQASALIFANHFFYNNINYFNDSDAGWFLLHNWSLSVEEQFYLLFPLGAAFLVRSRLSRRTVIFAITIAAFLVSVYIFHRNSSAAFYYAIARCWEFLAGVQIAVLARTVLLKKWQAELFSTLGLALILVPAMTVSTSVEFFGLPSMLPVIGAALLIWANLRSSGTMSSALLTTPGMRFLGKISYSVYLVHWPVLIFAKYALILELSEGWRTAMLLLSVILGWIGWRFVEMPFRQNALLTKTPGFVFAVGLAVITGFILMTANWVIVEKSGSDAITVETRNALSGRDDYSPQRRRCHSDEAAKPISPQNACRMGGDVDPTIAMWSDSHGVELTKAMANRLDADVSVLQLTSSSCPPLSDWDSAYQPRCREKNAAIFDYLRASPKIRTIVLTMLFDGYPQSSVAETMDAFEKTVAKLEGAGKKVILVAPFPLPEFDIPHGMARATIIPLSQLPESLPRALHDSRTAIVGKRLREISARYGATLIDPANSLCSSEKCAYKKDGHALYFDENHPSMHGVADVGRQIADVVIRDR